MTARLADLPAITPARVLELKRQAAAIKAAQGLKQSAALTQIAQREGFPSWERLIARAGGADACRAEKRDQQPTENRVRRNERRRFYEDRQ